MTGGRWFRCRGGCAGRASRGRYVRRRRELDCETVRLRDSSHSSKQSPCSSADSLPSSPLLSASWPMDRPDPQEGSGSSSQCACPVLSPRPVHRRKLIEPCRSPPLPRNSLQFLLPIHAEPDSRARQNSSSSEKTEHRLRCLQVRSPPSVVRLFVDRRVTLTEPGR